MIKNARPILGFIFILCSAKFAVGTFYKDLSTLERSVVDEGLKNFDLVPVENARGRMVRKIFVTVTSPFSSEAGFLTSLNRLHINSRDDVVRRELFCKEGEIFDEAAVRDSEIALRNQGLVRSLAVIVPVTTKDAQNQTEVDLLVATKDLLSLRPSFSFKASGAGSDFALTNFMISLGEHNLLGYNKSIAGIYEYQQSGHIISARYFDPALFKSRLNFTIKPSVILARKNLKFDGFLGDLKIEKPLESEADRFGYGVDLTYGSRPIIDFNGSKVRTFEIPSVNGSESFEKKYRWRYGKGSLYGRVSFGRTYKNEVFFSYGLNIKRPSILPDSGLDDDQIEYFKKHVLPKNELESFVTLGYAYFQNKFLTLYDYDNYKLQEIRRTGPSLTISNDFSSKDILFSDTNFLRPEMKFSFLQPIYQDSFIHGSISSSNRFDGSFTDNIFKYGVSYVSQKIFGLSRVVFEGRLSTVYNNRDNQKFVLGSDSGIRGVGSRFYSGDKGFRTNLEFRSVPIDLWIFHAGFVLFYDVGAAFDSFRAANPTHALGLGLRVLMPQVSSLPFRIDIAFPIYGRGTRDHVIVPSFGTGQAF